MSDSRGVVEGMALERLREIIIQRRSATSVWRAFLVAQVRIREANRRREMTTQRLFLMGQRP